MRRGIVVAVGLFGLLGVVAPGSSRAQDGPGSGFQYFSLAAVSGGQRIIADSIADQPPGTLQSGVPEAEATMTASSGHALSSVAWPSALAGNAGTLLQILGPFPCTPSALFDLLGLPVPPTCSPVGIPQPAMDQYHYLNSPVRAEALNPGKPSDENSIPGATMTARANADEVVADAILGGVLVTEIQRFGTARATSIVKVTGASTASADARSTVSDIELLGEVTIGSVNSHAHGETNGSQAKSSGATTVHDMKVRGIPVTVDNTGVHVSGQNADAVGPATQVVNEVLAGFGMTMYVTRPTQTVDGATTTFDAGSLIIDWFPPGAPGGMVFEFGGAHITASASLPFEATFEPTLGELPAGLSDPLILPSLDATGAASPLGGVVAPGGIPLQARQASAPRSLPDGLNAWWVVLGLAGAFAAAAGLRQLPTRVLDATSTGCESGEGT